MQIRDIMSSPAVTCRADDLLDVAAQLMWDHDCGAIPVTDETGKIIGMITDRDICMATYTRGHALKNIRVTDAMAKQVFACRADDSIDAAERMMSAKQIRRIPVVDRDNRAVGFLSLSDLARSADSRKKEPADREIVKTLSAICQPRLPGSGQRAAIEFRGHARM